MTEDPKRDDELLKAHLRAEIQKRINQTFVHYVPVLRDSRYHYSNQVGRLFHEWGICAWSKAYVIGGTILARYTEARLFKTGIWHVYAVLLTPPTYLYRLWKTIDSVLIKKRAAYVAKKKG